MVRFRSESDAIAVGAPIAVLGMLSFWYAVMTAVPYGQRAYAGGGLFLMGLGLGLALGTQRRRR